MSDGAAALSLVVRRRIAAPAAAVFAAWTTPAQLLRWWGPRGVTCVAAEIDLRVGGRYRIANRFADGRILWITGAFEVVSAPHELVYSWRLDPGSPSSEWVKVSFVPHGTETEVVVVHQHIADKATRETHTAGWQGCLDGLARELAAAG